MIKIVVNHLRSYIATPVSVALGDQIYRHCSYAVKGAFFSRAYRRGVWDGRKAFYARTRQIFPTGLLPGVLHVLQQQKVMWKIEDLREWPKVTWPTRPADISLAGITLRPDQQATIYKALRARVGIIQAPTGVGKTEIFCGILKYTMPLHPLVMVHSRTLLEQTRQRICERLRLKPHQVGMIAQGKFLPGDITVGMVQTLARHIKTPALQIWMQTCQVLIIDELHRYGANIWHKVGIRWPIPIRLGFSATADIDKQLLMHLQALTGPLIERMEFSEAVKKHIVVPPQIKIIPISDNGKKDLTSYADVYQNYIIDSPTRNAEICRLTERAVTTGQVLVFVSRHRHGQLLERQLPSYLKAKYISGLTAADTLRRVIEEFRSGKRKILITSTILDEGIDLPSVRTLVLAGGGKSSLKTVQRVGRGARKAEGKDKFVVYDFADTGNHYLARHALQRLADYRKMKWAVKFLR